MSVRVLWSLEEAIILLDFLLKSLNGEMARKEAISAVSKELRERAVKSGVEIDDVFRNINGITLQMSSMEYIYTDGKCGLAKPVKVFHEAVELYKNNTTEYLRLLKAAREVPEKKSVQDRFFEWVKKQVAPSKIANMFLVVQDIESFCIDRKILRKKLFETTDLPTIRQVHNTVTSNKIFRRKYRKKIDRIELLILQYHRFLKTEAMNQETEEVHPSEETIHLISNDKRNIIIETTEGKQESDVKVTRPKLNQQIEREHFKIWMQKTGMSNATARCYVSALNSFSVYLSNKVGHRVSVYEEDVGRLQELRELLFNDPEMNNLNVQFHRHISAAISKLVMYRKGEAVQIPIQKSSKDIIVCSNEAIPKIKLPDFSEMESGTGRGKDIERFEKILKEKFSEGLLPNPLKLDKFRMYFEEEYGFETTSDDDQLIDYLKCAGTMMDGRIYPNQDKKQSNLTADILTEIISTLNNGARCIYFDCVLERWRTELAKQLNVFNVDTLKALLEAQHVSGLWMTNNVLKATVQKVHPEENVVEVMRANHAFMDYKQLKDALWFIPIDVIKHALVTTPSIVNVDAETYFYAPNFPASAEELHQIKMYMANKLDEKGYLVAPDIYSIIHSKCLTVAINTTGYKDWAYRNIFKYIFREDFEFGSSVISKKGNALEMWQVYREYCREHDRITLSDLKQLKNELGVTIYWDTVMEEMVRINANELIRRDLIHFEVDAIDAVLDELCIGDYLPLKGITMFLHFPSIEYPWNSFVLESYLTISRKFCLYHASYANHGVFGVMVRRDSSFSDYRSVVIDMLSKSNQWKSTKQALELIVDNGYQARKKWVGFDKVAQEASLIRERIQEERE